VAGCEFQKTNSRQLLLNHYAFHDEAELVDAGLRPEVRIDKISSKLTFIV